MTAARAVAVIAVAASLCVPAEAEAAQRQRISLPAGPLGGAIIALGRQAGISIGISDPSLARAFVPAVSGNLTVRQALSRLLRGTGARAVFIDPYTIRIVRERSRAAERKARRPRPAPQSPPAAARPPQPQQGEEVIVVTAAKRPVPLATYPGPVTILSGGDATMTAGPPSTETLVRRLPSLSSTHLGTGRNKLFVRGVADSSFNGPTQSTVGQYLGETRLNYNAPDPDLRLYDIDRVELLPGPQGALYGAGSMGGIVRVVPNAPVFDRTEGSVSVGASATQHGEPGLDAAAVINLPLFPDRAAFRAVGYAMREGGYIDDVFRGKEDVNRVAVAGGRGAVRVQPGGGWTFDLGLTGQVIRGEDAQYAEINAPRLSRRSDAQQEFSNDFLLGQLVATREWGSHRLVLAGTAVHQDLQENYDLRGVGPNSTPDPEREPLLVVEENRVRLLSFEARLSRQRRSGKGWLVGGSLVSNRSLQVDTIGRPSNLIEFARIRNDIQEATAFGDLTIGLVPHVTGTVGGRVSYSRISGPTPGGTGEIAGPGGDPEPFTGTEETQRTQLLLLPSAALAADLGSDLMLFARYQEAFRPGGVQYIGGELTSFRRDEVAAVETGLRYGQPGRGTFDASASVSYARWTDIQADFVNGFGRSTTGNVGDGRIYTLDLNARWRPIAGLSLDASAVFNDGIIDDPAQVLGMFGPSLDDDKALFPNVARFNGRLGAEYRVPVRAGVDLQLWAGARYAGKSVLGVGTPLNRRQGDWIDVNAGGRLMAGRHAFVLNVTNLLDVEGNRFSFGSPYTFARDVSRQITPLRPRTVRLAYEIAF